mgnify:CR=1 FL=1
MPIGAAHAWPISHQAHTLSPRPALNHFFALSPRFLLRGGSRGGSPGSPRERSYPYRSSFYDPGPQPEHPSGPCLTGTTTRIQGLGRSPPRLRLEITCEWACNRKEQYRNNRNSTMIDDVNPNAPPRGHTLLSFCAGEKKGKEQKQAKHVPRRPSWKTRAASGAQADSLSRFTGARRRADTLPPPNKIRRRGG